MYYLAMIGFAKVLVGWRRALTVSATRKESSVTPGLESVET